MITDRIGRHEVPIPINNNRITKFVIFWAFLNPNTGNFASNEKKKSFQLARDGAYCPVTLARRVLSYYTVLLVLKSEQLIATQI